MAERKWIKFYTDQRLEDIETLRRGEIFVLIWIKLLLLAGDVCDGGKIYFTNKKPYTIKQLSTKFRKRQKDIVEALDLLEEAGMIERDESGVIYISAWETYKNFGQEERVRKQTRERVARYRERQKMKACNGERNGEKGGECNGEERGEERKKGKEEKKDIKKEEKEKKKEFHSFIRSLSREEEDAILLTLFSADKIAEATDEERAAMLAHINERKKRHAIASKLGKGLVMLSDEQYEKLCEELSLDEIHKYIPIIADEEAKGHHYTRKTHYQAIMDMARRDRKS